MKLKLLAAVAALSLSGAAFAGDQSVSFSGGVAGFKSSDGLINGPLLDGGDDVISMTGLAPGLYNFVFTFSSFGVDFAQGSVTVNGQAATLFGGLGLTFGQLISTGNSPLTVVVTGLPAPIPGFGTSAYSGEITVALIPEPGTYAMMLAGLGAIGFVASRRRAAAK